MVSLRPGVSAVVVACLLVLAAASVRAEVFCVSGSAGLEAALAAAAKNRADDEVRIVSGSVAVWPASAAETGYSLSVTSGWDAACSVRRQAPAAAFDRQAPAARQRDLGRDPRPQRSTTGPVPPPSLRRARRDGAYVPRSAGATMATIGVPAYLWRHGCGPTAVGMVAGYWDGRGFASLYPGSAATQTEAVNQGMASERNATDSGHYWDYSVPIDSDTLLADRSELGGAHEDDSIADFMQTSWSLMGNLYGWSYSDMIAPSLREYAALKSPAYYVAAGDYFMRYHPRLTWEMVTAEIDAGRPMVFLVDTWGDGYTDHFVTVVGYRDDGVTREYGCLDTWDPVDVVHWEEFAPVALGRPWGVYQGTTFGLSPSPDGTVAWTADIQEKMFASAALVPDGSLRVVAINGTVVGLDADGTKAWATPGPGSHSADATPAVAADGTAYVPDAGTGIRAVNATGAVLWTTNVSVGAVSTSPAIGADSTVYLGTSDGNLLALSPGGATKWSFAAGGAVNSSPAVAPDGTIYAGSDDGSLYAINPDGSLRWAYAVGAPVGSSPAVGAGGVVYCGADDGYLYALSPEGALKWRVATGPPEDLNSSPAIGGRGRIFIGGTDGKLYAVSPQGSVEWTFDVDDWPVLSSPAVGADGTVYIGSSRNQLYAVNADGTLRWKQTFWRGMYSSPAIGPDGTLYLAGYDRMVYALRTTCGGPADSPWPMFRANARRTGRDLFSPSPAPGQPGVAVTSAASCDLAGLDTRYGLRGTPGSKLVSFNATVGTPGAYAVLRFELEGLGGPLSDLQFYKFDPVAGAARPFGPFRGHEANATDGAWWIKDASGTCVPASGSLDPDQAYALDFVVKDNGAYDGNGAWGAIEDPSGLVRSSSASGGGSGGGCSASGAGTDGARAALLLLAALALAVRRAGPGNTGRG